MSKFPKHILHEPTGKKTKHNEKSTCAGRSEYILSANRFSGVTLISLLFRLSFWNSHHASPRPPRDFRFSLNDNCYNVDETSLIIFHIQNLKASEKLINISYVGMREERRRSIYKYWKTCDSVWMLLQHLSMSFVLIVQYITPAFKTRNIGHSVDVWFDGCNMRKLNYYEISRKESATNNGCPIHINPILPLKNTFLSFLVLLTIPI